MANKTIGTKVVVEGVSSFKSQMGECAGAVKALNAESKALQAEFKATGNEQQYLEKTYANLTKKMEMQKRMVNTAKQALAQLAKEGYGSNSKQVQEWQVSLSKAQAGMFETQASINETVARVHELGGTFVEVGETATGASKDIGSVGEGFDTSGAKDSATDVSEGVEGASASAEETKEKVGEVGGEFDTADAKASADQVSDDVSGAADSAEKTKDDIAGVGDEFDTTGAAASADTVSEDVAGAADSATDTKTKIGEVGGEFETSGAETSATDTSEKVAEAASTAEDTKAAIAGVGGEFDTTGVGTSAEAVAEKIQWAASGAEDAKADVAGVGGEFETGGVEGSAGDVQEAVNGIDGEGAQTELGKIGQAIDIQGALSSIKSIEEGLSGVVKKAANAAKALFSMGADSGKWADELITTASVMGISTTELQQMRDASNYMDTSVETMESAMTRIAQNRDSKSWLESLGNLGDASGTKIEIDGQSSLEVLGQIIDALTQIEDFSQREELATNLLGRSAKDFNPIIDAGGWQAYLEQMEKAPVVAEDLVKSLGSLDDANNGAQASLDALKHEVMAELAPAFESGAQALTEFVEKLREFVQSEKGQAAINALSEAMTNLISAFTSEGNIQTIFDTITTAVEKLTGALEWMADPKNKDTVVKAIEAIGAAFGLLKVSETVLTFMQLANSAKSLFGGGAGGAASVGGAMAKGGGASTAAKAALGKLGVSALPVAMGVGSLAAGGYLMYNMATYTDRTYGGYDRAVKNYAESGDRWAAKAEKQKAELEEVKQKADEANAALENLTMGQVGDDVKELQKQLNAGGAGIKEDGIVGPETMSAMEAAAKQASAEAEAAEAATSESVARIEHLMQMRDEALAVAAMYDDPDATMPDIIAATKDYYAKYGEELAGMFDDIDLFAGIREVFGKDNFNAEEVFGNEFMLGGGSENLETFATQAAERLLGLMNSELADGAGDVEASVKTMTDSASQQAETDLASGGAAGGAGFDMSIAEAIVANAGAVYEAASQMGANAAAAFDATYKSRISAPASSSSPGYGGGGGGVANVTIELNGQKLGEAVAPIVDREIGSAAKKRR